MVLFWVGVSGFSYAGWKGTFYPKDTKPENMLQVYSSKLNSVEINSTFYAMPRGDTTRKWGLSTQEDFRISFKANRQITHIKKLRNVEPEVSMFVKALEPLGQKLGCLLIQLPPFMRRDLTLLETFLSEWPNSPKIAFEFRHSSWLAPEAYALLTKYGVALCAADTEDMKPVFERTAPFAYARLRQDRYSKQQLEDHAKRIAKYAEDASDCFVYFKHDEAGEAANMATAFRALL